MWTNEPMQHALRTAATNHQLTALNSFEELSPDSKCNVHFDRKILTIEPRRIMAMPLDVIDNLNDLVAFPSVLETSSTCPEVAVDRHAWPLVCCSFRK